MVRPAPFPSHSCHTITTYTTTTTKGAGPSPLVAIGLYFAGPLTGAGLAAAFFALTNLDECKKKADDDDYEAVDSKA